MQNYYYQPNINDTYLNRLQRLNQIQNQFNNQYPQYNNPLPLNNQIIFVQGETGAKAYQIPNNTTEIAKNEGISFKQFNEYDWFYVLNMIYSDFYKVFVNNINLYVKTAVEWLNDIDVKSGKAYRYYIKVVK